MEGILSHPFMTSCIEIPESLPAITQTCPPPLAFLEKYTKRLAKVVTSKNLNN